MKNLIGMLLCGGAVILLASSDAMINTAASHVLGSTEESRSSARLVAVGVTIGLLALGSLALVIKDDLARIALWIAVVFGSLFSGALTVTATSIDFAANDNNGQIEKHRRSSNEYAIEQLTIDKNTNLELINECKRDRYWTKDCLQARVENKEITNKIQSLDKDSTNSVMSQQVDISSAIETKAGIPGAAIESLNIYSRAICVPIMITILMTGFWLFWDQLFKSSGLSHVAFVKKKPVARKKSLSKTVNSSSSSNKSTNNSSSSSKNSVTNSSSRGIKPKQKGAVSVKNDIEARTKAASYYSKHGKYPSTRELQKLAGIGPARACKVLKELKGRKAA